MRTPLDSPFSPGSDSVPAVWAGRTTQLSDWHDVLRPRRLSGIAERGRTILGEAGSGKSALVRRIAREATDVGDWVSPQLRIPTGTDPLKRMASALLDLAGMAGLATAREKRIAGLLGRVESVAMSGLSLSLRQNEGPEAYTALTDLLVEVGRAAHDADVMVVLHLDEVQNMGDRHALSQVLVAVGDALTYEHQVEAPGAVRFMRALPIAVFLTGLPEFADMAGARTGATFARRFQTVTLDAIDDVSLVAALQPFVSQGWEVAGATRPGDGAPGRGPDDGSPGRVFMEPAAQRAIVERACGEPFLFQLAGERAWYAGNGPVITAQEVSRGWQGAADEAEAHVQRILERLPDGEREVLEAMAGLDPADRTLTRIAREAGFARTTDAGPASRRLDITRGIIRRGKPYTFRHRAVEAYLTSSWPRLG